MGAEEGIYSGMATYNFILRLKCKGGILMATHLRNGNYGIEKGAMVESCVRSVAVNCMSTMEMITEV